MRFKRAALWLLAATIVVAAIRLWPHAPLSSHASSSVAVYDSSNRLLRLTLASDERYRVWTPLESMSPTLVDAVLLQEDRWFRWHPGFNPVSLARGAFVSYVARGHRQGGSTLTMQLARLLYRLDTKSPVGKLEQIGAAIMLEARYSKHDLLEAYLNFAPYGRNVEGVGAASLVYFDKSSAAISLPEALTLAVLPQDPTRRSAIDTGLAAARKRLFARWVAAHPRDESQRSLLDLPLALRAPEKLPFAAPHFVEQVLVDARIEGKLAPRIGTTLDLGLQKALERQLTRHVERLKERGIHNASALLVDTRDLGIKAMVGSADYFDDAISGQVNGTGAKRSPGSALKPFIYALGIDQGQLHPLTVLRDVPTAYGPFTPENFDGRFLGPVTATQALVRSRNIPAVTVAAKLSKPSFYDFLKNAGVSRMSSEQYYGLALVLGGGEVTMQELARLYAMLANGGALRGLRDREGQPLGDGVRLLSEEASFMTLDMLRQNPRPDEVLAAESGGLPVYWKTGTSWGFRDAWTAGIFGPYVLVVWVGNFDGSPNPALVGIETAAPLFFRMVDAIKAQQPGIAEPLRTPPPGVRKVEVCLASGDLPNAWCPKRASTWFIPGKSPIRVSTIHRPVVIDDATNEPACAPFDGKKTHVEVYEFWPSDLARVFARAGIPRKTPPTAKCDAVEPGEGQAPNVTSPLRGGVYTVRAHRDGEERIALAATSDADVHSLYWFVDDAYVGSAAPGEALFWQPAAAGPYTVRVVDDHGRADSRALRIAAVE